MITYECPLCGKKWKTTSDLAKCVAADDKQFQAKGIKEKQEKTNLLANKKKEIEEIYKDLSGKVKDYNNLAAEFEKQYKTGVSNIEISYNFYAKKDAPPKEEKVLKSSVKENSNCNCKKYKNRADWLDDLFTYYWGI